MNDGMTLEDGGGVSATDVAARPNDGVEGLIRLALSGHGGPDVLKAWLAVGRQWNADQAAAAFNSAVVTFQQAAPVVEKGDTANGRAYARMDRIWRSVRPLLRQCGLAVTWERVSVTGEVCALDGHLRHARGHAEALHHEIPLPQAIPGQNAAQRAGSAETYAKRYATLAALGLTTGDDDDGNCGQVVPPAVTQEQEAQIRELCEELGREPLKALAYARAEGAEKALAVLTQAKRKAVRA
jgi:hypothetical protein